MLPQFSIVMPAFNAELYIATAIQSVLGQTFQSYELLIVDDGSADLTLSIASSFSKSDPRVKILCNKYDKGAAGARNTAIDAALGRFISFLDSDDFWGPNVLASQRRCFDEGAVILHSNIYLVDSSGIPFERLAFPRSVGFRAMLFSNFMPNLSVSYSVPHCGKVFAPLIASRNDYALWLRLLSSTTYSSCNAGDIGAYYRVTNSGLSSSGFFANLSRYLSVVSGYVGAFSLLLLPFYLFILVIKKSNPRIFSLLCSMI